MSILIKDVLLDNKKTDIHIEDNLIKEIGKKVEADVVIDGKNKAVIPGFINTHTHAAMTLLRSYADDMELHDWLQNKIWPLEAKLTEDDVYWGTKLACLEMIKSGTTCFNDMYWYVSSVAKAVEDMGIRAVVSAVFIDLFDKKKSDEQIKENKKSVKNFKSKSKRVRIALGPHAIYTVSKESLQWAKEFADKNKLMIHIHLSETKKEVDDSIKSNGKTPVEYLDDIGFLGANVIATHCVWLSKRDIEILARNDVKIAHNPTSNMKLASGIMHYKEMKESGLTISLGTDGCASNNNLDMFESMKFASLGQKAFYNDQTIMKSREAFELATVNGAKALRLNAGMIKENMLADLILIDLKKAELTPNYNLISNIVYSANGSCVDTVICDGKILMENHIVKDEEEIIEKVNKVAQDLVSR